MKAITPSTSLINYSSALAGFVGTAGFVISQVGVMVNHPMTRTFHSFLHLIGTGGGILLLSHLVVSYVMPNLTRLKLPGFLGATLFLVGLVLFITGTFNYAILHGLLNLVTINDPIHQIPLMLAPYTLCVGAFLIGLASFYNKTLSLPLAVFLMLASLVYAWGWWYFGDSMQRNTNLSRYLKAALVVFPFGIAWLWLCFEQLKQLKVKKEI